MSSLLLAAAVLVPGAAVWWAVSRLGPTLRPSPPPPALAIPPSDVRVPEPDPLPAPSRSLAVVVVAVDEIARAARQLGEGFESDARAEVAEALRAAVRRRDICTPWRDDRVVAVLPGVDLEQAPGLRWRVQRALSELRIITHAGEEVPLGFRVASACSPQDGASESDLLAAAEAQLARTRPASTSTPGSASSQLCAALPILHN